jgi:hypothetical protein
LKLQRLGKGKRREPPNILRLDPDRGSRHIAFFSGCFLLGQKLQMALNANGMRTYLRTLVVGLAAAIVPQVPVAAQSARDMVNIFGAIVQTAMV